MKRKMSKICTPYPLLMFMAFILFYTLTSFADEIISTQENPAKVIDGDSLEIGNARIRLIGIDAPEYAQYCKNEQNQKYPCGQISSEYLQRLTKNQTVVCKIHHKDKYKRDLCTCYVGALDLNREMILSGNAITYLDTIYQKEQEIAKANKNGMWKGKFMHPRLFRRLKQTQKSKFLNFKANSY